MSFNKVKHRTYCPQYSSAGSRWQVKLQLSCCMPLLAGAVEASLTATRGAGGFSLSPALRIISMAPSNAPAFSLLHFEIKECMILKEIEDLLDVKANQLLQLHAERKASPFDIDTRGETVMHVCDSSLESIIAPLTRSRKRTACSIPIGGSTHFWMLVCFLIDSSRESMDLAFL